MAGVVLLTGGQGAQAGAQVDAQARRGDPVAELEAALAAQDSATAVLAARCGAPITAQVVRDMVGRPPTDVPWPFPATAVLEFRHVALQCRGVTVSLASNWYDTGLLDAAMNTALETTDVPFGKIVAPLAYRRERIDSRHGPGMGCTQGTVLSHRARLLLPDGRPLALLVECYQRAALADTASPSR